MAKKDTTTTFVIKASDLYGPTAYDFSQVVYVNSRTPVLVTHLECNSTYLVVPNRFLKGRGCKTCTNRKKGPARMTAVEFITRANIIHNGAYDYSLVEYTTAHVPVIIRCHTHGQFLQRPAKHLLQSTGCPACGALRAGDKNRSSTAYFTDRARVVHGNKYDYSQSQYTTVHTPVQIECPIHGTFFQSPTNHVDFHNQNGCPKCSSTCFSNAAIEWLDWVADHTAVRIQHMLNDKEFRVPGTSFKVDGYCADTNTIYEFYGDCFHGNPVMFDPDFSCHPFDKTVSAGVLYARTLKRETALKNLGYTIVTMWEHDWNRQRKMLRSST